MARSLEKSLWGWLKKGIKDLGTRKHDIQRVESSVAKGVPDVEGCIKSESFWCELKVASRKSETASWNIAITQSQVNWAYRRCRAGGKSWVLVRLDGKTWRDNRHYLVWGTDAKRLMKAIDETELAALAVNRPGAGPAELFHQMLVDPLS